MLGLDDIEDQDTAGAFSDIQSSTLAVNAHPSRFFQTTLCIEKVTDVPQVGVEQLDAAVLAVQYVDESVRVEGDVYWAVHLSAVC